jgi:hypothetical protein
MTKKIVFAVAVALASQACISEDIEDTTTAAESELGIPGGGSSGNHFYFAAYSKVPYIYKGCPDPGPEPWNSKPTLLAKKGMKVIELELGTAVALEVRAGSLPAGMTIKPNARGATLVIGNPNDLVPFSLKVSHKTCAYEVQAEIAFQ